MAFIPSSEKIPRNNRRHMNTTISDSVILYLVKQVSKIFIIDTKKNSLDLTGNIITSSWNIFTKIFEIHASKNIMIFNNKNNKMVIKTFP